MQLSENQRIPGLGRIVHVNHTFKHRTSELDEGKAVQCAFVEMEAGNGKLIQVIPYAAIQQFLNQQPKQ